MPIIKSAKKRVRVARKATIRNVKTKRSLRDAIKSFHASLKSGNKDVAEKHKEAQSNLDKAVKKNVMHKNKVARKQRQLAAAAKEAGIKPTATAKKATTAKKPAATKKTTKTTTAKKTAAAKAPAKKPATKKPASK